MSGKAIGTDELVVRDTKFLDADEILIGKSGHQMVSEYQEQSRKIKLFLQELLLTDMEVNGENIHHQQEYHMNKGHFHILRTQMHTINMKY